MVDGSDMPDWLINRIQNATACGACGKICQYDSKNTGYVLSQDGWTRVNDMKSNSACAVFPPSDVDVKCGQANAQQVLSWQMCSDEQTGLINVPMLIVVLFALGVLAVCNHSSSSAKRNERERMKMFFVDE